MVEPIVAEPVMAAPEPVVAEPIIPEPAHSAMDSATEQAIAQALAAAPAAPARRRRTPSRRIEDSVVADIVEAVAPLLEGSSAPRSVEPVFPRVTEPVIPRAAEPVIPLVAEPVIPRAAEPVIPLVAEPVTPRFEEPTSVRPHTAAAPRVEEPVTPSFENPATPQTEQHAGPRLDEFERAARLFSFTGENPTFSATSGTPAASTSTVETAHAVPRTRRARRIAAASLSLVAIGAVGLLTVGMTLPTEAVAAATGTPDAAQQVASHANDGGDGDIQAYVASSTGNGGVQGALQRSSGFTTGSVVQLAGTAGISNVSGSTFSNNQNCPVQWPFAIGVPISYGFGPRPGEFHEGVDFTPGMGAHIQAIADGVVAVAQDNYQGYGTAIIIDHVINGQKVASLYGHMELGSMQVHVGQKVKVGEYIGRTGDTGHSFGAHTHVEIRQNDVTPIDPLPWLRAHNQC